MKIGQHEIPQYQLSNLRSKLGGGVVILAMASLDFLVVREMLEQSNMKVVTGILVALVLCAGLEGGPTLLGVGLMMLRSKFGLKHGQGKIRPILSIALGGVATVAAFSTYFYLRRELILSNGGFGDVDLAIDGLQHYEGFYGDVIAMVSPLITSVIAFVVSLFISSSGLDNHEKNISLRKKELDAATVICNELEGALRDALSREWYYRFPGQSIPMTSTGMMDVSDACEKINANISAELRPLLAMALSGILAESTVLDPFVAELKSVFRGHMENGDESLLAQLDFAKFTGRIQDARQEVLAQIRISSADILDIFT